MKIKVKDTIEREITIEFPSFYKSTETYSKLTYYALFSEQLALCISEGFTYQVNPQRAMQDYKGLVPCDKSEVEQVFKANQKFFATTMEGITVDLNSNTPSEVLENL